MQSISAMTFEKGNGVNFFVCIYGLEKTVLWAKQDDLETEFSI